MNNTTLGPNDSTHYGNLTSRAGNGVVSFTNNVSTCPFGDLRISTRTMLFSLSSTFGTSQLRDIVTVASGGTVVNVVSNPSNPHYALNVTAANSAAGLQSIERGCVTVNMGAEACIAVRIPSAFVTTQAFRFGYFDVGTFPTPWSGFYWMYNASGISVCVSVNGVETVFPQSTWNVDMLDGTGTSGYTLDVARGNMFFVVLTGFGVQFRAAFTDDDGNMYTQTVHNYEPPGAMNDSIDVNISAVLTNGTSTAPNTVYVTGRQFSIMGRVRMALTSRITSPYRLVKSIAANAGFLPLLSVRRKANYQGVRIRLSSFDFFTSTNCLYQFRLGCTLTGASYGNIPDTVTTETALQADTTATAASGGIVIYSGIATIGSSGELVRCNDKIDIVLGDNQTLTLVVDALNNTNTVSAVIRVREYW